MPKNEIQGDRRKAQRFGEWLVIWEVYQWDITAENEDVKECVARFYDAREAMAWTLSNYGIVGTSVEASMTKAF